MLFVCSRNQWRSPTAERLFRGDPSMTVRSAGTSSAARRRVSAGDLEWAEVVLVMEAHHQKRLRRDFPDATVDIVVLDIADDFQFMAPDLIELLESAVPSALAGRVPPEVS